MDKRLRNLLSISVSIAPEGLMRLLEGVCADLRGGIHHLRQNLSFTIVAVLTLAIGIGANTVVFSQVNAVFLKTLDVRNPDQLRTLAWTSPKRGFAGLG